MRISSGNTRDNFTTDNLRVVDRVEGPIRCHGPRFRGPDPERPSGRRGAHDILAQSHGTSPDASAPDSLLVPLRDEQNKLLPTTRSRVGSRKWPLSRTCTSSTECCVGQRRTTSSGKCTWLTRRESEDSCTANGNQVSPIPSPKFERFHGRSPCCRFRHDVTTDSAPNSLASVRICNRSPAVTRRCCDAYR